VESTVDAQRRLYRSRSPDISYLSSATPLAAIALWFAVRSFYWAGSARTDGMRKGVWFEIAVGLVLAVALLTIQIQDFANLSRRLDDNARSCEHCPTRCPRHPPRPRIAARGSVEARCVGTEDRRPKSTKSTASVGAGPKMNDKALNSPQGCCQMLCHLRAKRQYSSPNQVTWPECK
jgi:hypothetical protein